MPQVSRALWTVLATYALIHAGYLLSGFNPIRDMQTPLGWIVDFSAWMVVYASIYWALGRRSTQQRSGDSIR